MVTWLPQQILSKVGGTALDRSANNSQLLEQLGVGHVQEQAVGHGLHRPLVQRARRLHVICRATEAAMRHRVGWGTRESADSRGMS